MASTTRTPTTLDRMTMSWLGDLVMSLFTAAGYLLWWAALFPAISLPIVASLALGITHGPRAGVVCAVVCSVGYTGWAWLDARSFRSWVTEPVRRRWLTWSRYTRAWEIDLHPAQAERHPGRTHPHPDPAHRDDRENQRCVGGADRHRPIGGRLAQTVRCAGRRLARRPNHDRRHRARRTQDHVDAW